MSARDIVGTQTQGAGTRAAPGLVAAGGLFGVTFDDMLADVGALAAATEENGYPSHIAQASGG